MQRVKGLQSQRAKGKVKPKDNHRSIIKWTATIVLHYEIVEENSKHDLEIKQFKTIEYLTKNSRRQDKVERTLKNDL